MKWKVKNNWFKLDIFFNIIDAGTVTFDHFISSLLTKNISLFKKIFLIPNFWTVVYIFK